MFRYFPGPSHAQPPGKRQAKPGFVPRVPRLRVANREGCVQCRYSYFPGYAPSSWANTSTRRDRSVKRSNNFFSFVLDSHKVVYLMGVTYLRQCGLGGWLQRQLLPLPGSAEQNLGDLRQCPVAAQERKTAQGCLVYLERLVVAHFVNKDIFEFGFQNLE